MFIVAIAASLLAVLTFAETSPRARAEADYTRFSREEAYWKRRLRLHKIADQSLLALIAERDPEEVVRMEAVERITDQALLGRIALRASEWAIRLAAAERIADTGALERLARDDGHWAVRRKALERSASPALASELAVQDPHHAVRNAALAFVMDPALLARIALSDADGEVARTATRRIEDPALLARIRHDSAQPAARRTALAKSSADWRRDLEVARAQCDATSCFATVENFSDQITYADFRYVVRDERSGRDLTEGTFAERIPPGHSRRLYLETSGFAGNVLELMGAQGDDAPLPGDPLPPRGPLDRAGTLTCTKGNEKTTLDVPSGGLRPIRVVARMMGFAVSDCRFDAAAE